MKLTRTAALLAGCLLLATPASAVTHPAPPMLLPGQVSSARVSATTADTGTWIVGARPTAAAAAIARRYGAHAFLSEKTAYLVARGRASAFAKALRRHRLLSFAEPNWRERDSAFPQDPLFSLQAPLLKSINPALTPPPVTPTSPLLAINDAQIYAAHPDFAGTQLTLANPALPVTDLHGTAVASVAGAAANGTGMVGVWPGMRLLGEQNALTCASVAKADDAADQAHAAVINMSYGGPYCFAEDIALSYAFGDGVIPVAAGGNDFQTGNHIAFPASDPHVLTVAATDQNDQPAFFSSENDGIDLSAPGVGILAAVPPALDNDGTPDGYQIVAGTSFSTPIVSAAAAWLEAARPGLANDQYMDLLNSSADDLGHPGYDQAFGYGRLNLQRALTLKAGPHDFDEPNDDIPWVNGVLYKRPDTPIFGKHAKRGGTGGYIDQWEDPADVYRVWLPAHSRVKFALRSFQGEAQLGIFSRRARTIYAHRGLIRLSRRRSKRIDIVIKNSSRHATIAYAAVGVNPKARLLNAAYTLTIRRLK